jgi:eukaryotic-like serine/threonine-protein kinase
VNEDQPRWDGATHIYFRAAEGKSNFLYRMNEDGSNRAKVSANPILEFFAVSPDGRWAAAAQTVPSARVFAVPVGGGTPAPLCSRFCVPQWTSDGKTLAIVVYPMEGTKTSVYPVLASSGLPAMPPSGVEDVAQLKSAKVLNGSVILGPTPEVTATEREEVHRNLYRVPLE